VAGVKRNDAECDLRLAGNESLGTEPGQRLAQPILVANSVQVSERQLQARPELAGPDCGTPDG
jgi:hypothetical protein